MNINETAVCLSPVIAWLNADFELGRRIGLC
jgi:hypothetical protein